MHGLEPTFCKTPLDSMPRSILDQRPKKQALAFKSNKNRGINKRLENAD